MKKLKFKEIVAELNLIPKSMIAGMAFGFSTGLIWDIVLGFALSQIFWLLLSYFLKQTILIDLFNFNPRLVKWTLALLSPLLIPCFASLLMQQSLTAMLLSSLAGFIGAKILHHSANHIAQMMTASESLWLNLGGYGLKGIALALT